MMMKTAIERGRVRPTAANRPVSEAAKLSVAYALPRKPERVIAIWMVERNLVGTSEIFFSLTARLSPSSISLLMWFSLTEMTAISAQAK